MHSCPSPKSRRRIMIWRLVTFAVVLSVTAAATAPTTVLATATGTSSSRRQPTLASPAPPSSTTHGSRLSPSATPAHQPEHRGLFRRVPVDIISTDTLWQEPPVPSDWLNPNPRSSPPPRPRSSTTTSEDKPFALSPSNNPGVGHAPPPPDLSPSNRGNEMPGPPDKHGMDLSRFEPSVPKDKRPGDPTTMPRLAPDMGLFNTPDFVNIWSDDNLPPLPGTPIGDDPLIPSPPLDNDRPPTPTAQPGGGGSLPDLPPAPRAAMATPTFNAIPIIPPVLTSLNPALSNRTQGEPPATAACGDGWCTVTESCASCPKDCSVSHFDMFGYNRQREQAQSPLFRPSHDPSFLTFNCAAPQFVQFCPWPPNSTVTGTSRKQSAMLAIVGSHPSPSTARLPSLLSTVPASAVAVFLDVQLLTAPNADAVEMRKSINLLRTTGYHLGLSLGSTSMPTPNALSTTSILRAHQVYAHLPAWLAQPELDTTTLSSFLSSSHDFAPALPANWPPLSLTTDPNSSYLHALSPAIAQLLHALSTRILVPSVPVYDHVITDTQVNAAASAVDSIARTLRGRPGVPGWIIGLDASGAQGDEAVRRVVHEVGVRAEWVGGGVRACFEYRSVPDEAGTGNLTQRRSVREVVEVVRRRARPAVPEPGWRAEVAVEGAGREVREVSEGEEDGW